MKRIRVWASAPGSRLKSDAAWQAAPTAAMLDELRAAVQLGDVQERFDLAVKLTRIDGVAVPCLDEPRGWWVSNRVAERARAARKCVDCPLLAVCDDLAQAAEASWGVWAGRDYSPRDVRARLPLPPEQDPDAARLRALGKLPTSAERRTERNRLIVLLRSRDPKHWTHVRLAEAGGLSHKEVVYRILASGGRSSKRPVESTAETRKQHREAQATRRISERERLLAEVAQVDDPRLAHLRELGGSRQGPGRDWEREPRNELLAELALSDPWWTYARLGVAAGMSDNGVRYAVRSVIQSRHERKRATSVPESA